MTVNIRQFILETYKDFKDYGSAIRPTLRAGMSVYNGIYFTITSRFPIGTNVFSEEWDLLIVLDACRVDAMKRVADEYDFITDVGAIWSVGSSSHEWTVQTFSNKYQDAIEKSAYISTNPFSYRTFVDKKVPPYDTPLPFGSLAWQPVEENDFGYYEQVSSDGTDFTDTVPPSKVTDRAIDVIRNRSYDRTVVHYFQPHRPFVTRTEDPTTEAQLTFDRPFDEYEAGNLTYEELWEGYLENLRAALDSVELLLKNVDAKQVVITADHGQLIGDLGMRITGHPEGLPHPTVKRVPWVRTTATDTETHTPTTERTSDVESLEERLENLGYI